MSRLESFREYLLGPRTLEAGSLAEFIKLGNDQRIFYVDSYISLIRERHIGRKNGLIIPRVIYKGHAYPRPEIKYIQTQEDAGLTEEQLTIPEQKTRVELAALLTANLSLQRIQEQIQNVAVKLYDNRRPLNYDAVQQLLLDAEALGVKPFPIR